MAYKHFAIRVDAIASDEFAILLGPYTATPETGGAIVIFRRFDNSVEFFAQSSILQINDEKTNDDPPRVRRTVKLGEVTAFDKPRELDVLAGSLRKVQNFASPEKHFSRRRIVGLLEEDFVAIRDYRMNVSRSLFRRLFPALPTDVQADFVRTNYEDLRRELDPEGRVRSYVVPSKLLLTYLQDHIAETLRILRQVSILHEDLLVRLADQGQKLPPLTDLVLSNGIGDGDELDFGIACGQAARLFLPGGAFGPAHREVKDASAPNLGFLEEALAELSEVASEEGEEEWLERTF